MENRTAFDVLVCGGGVAGVAAAIGAARMGARTALVEKTILFGGLATSGLINVYLPLCDGNGRQVTFGIAEELLRLSMRYGPGEIPDWRKSRGAKEDKRFRVTFSAAAFALALDEALLEAGVDLWLDTLACRPILNGDAVSGVEVETKGGRIPLEARCVVDATGDADIAFRAGAPCAEETNSLALWALEADLDAETAASLDGRGRGKVATVRFGRHKRGADEPHPWRGTDAREVTRFVIAAREKLRERCRRLQEEEGEAVRLRRFPVTLPTMAQFRTTRRILGRATMNDGEHGVARSDSIGLVADWRKPGFVWEVPFGALVPQGARGLLVAGRCISSAGDAWEVTRVIPAAALTGQVCGTAAAVAARSGKMPDETDVEDLRREIERAGMATRKERPV